MSTRVTARRAPRLAVLFVLLCAIGVAPPARAAARQAGSADRTGAARGRLTDPDGLPAPSVVVTIRNVLSGTSVTTRTASDGTFVVRDLAPGFYEITASASGFALDPRRVQVSAAGTINAGDLRLSLTSAHEDVVVSASRVTELENDAPTKVLVVTHDDIQQTGDERVGDVLAEVPGIVTRAQSYGVGLPAGEQIDGIDTKETAVLVDGLPLVGARGINEGLLDLDQQSVGPVDRIEVVKGAASALYGTDALGGVVNLVSREPTTPLDVDANVSGGSLGEFDSRAGVGGRWDRDRLMAFVDVDHHQRNGYSLISNDPSTVSADEHRENVLAKARYAFTPRATLGVTVTGYRNHELGQGTTAGVDPSDPSNFTNTPTTLRSNDSGQTAALIGDFALTASTALQARVYSSSYDEDSDSRLVDDGVEGPEFDVGTLHETYRRADATLSQQIGRWQFLQLGYEGVRDEYRGDNRIVGGDAGQALTTNDVWFEDRIQPARAVVLAVGGRYQHNSTFGGHFVPDAGLVYRVGNHVTLRTAAGAGFRAPNLGELYYHLLHLEYGYQVIGNPTLQPETSQSYSGGGTFTAGRYRLSVNAFRHDLHNLIDYVSVCDVTEGQDCSGAALDAIMAKYGVPPSFDYDASGAAYFTFVNLNVDRARTEGVDLDGRATLTPSLALSAAYTYLNAVDVATGDPLPYRSHNQGHVALEFTRPAWGLTANVRGTFFGKWPTSSDTGGPTGFAYGYAIWSAYVSKSLGAGVRPFFAVDNLANSRDRKLTEAEPTFDRPDYGRTYRIGLQYAFDRHR